MTLKQWIKSPKGYVAIAMVLYWLTASYLLHDLGGLINGLLAVGVGLIVDVVCCLVERRKKIFPDGTLITGLIIALILGTTTAWYVVAATVTMAILSKHLFTYRKKAVFNPAAFGLMLSIPIFATRQSWWGAFGDLPVWTVVLLFIGGYVITSRINKFAQVFAFFGTSFGLLLLMGLLHIENAGNAFDGLRSPFINAMLFFGFFMLTDPPTSPAKPKDQVVFGILVALVGTTVYEQFGGLMYLFVGLMAGNLYHWAKARLSSKAPKQNGSRLSRVNKVS
ncbi:RnfABCDGE type electron transport complex subunit D [Paenibacillus puldeungensis]|uniref:RnfABCDGE type electron transport complex subunit D n=1 Tax=Paenibacillus puldeungensis TaxID=696536 RepID=A0ABW3RTP1_9BACL